MSALDLTIGFLSQNCYNSVKENIQLAEIAIADTKPADLLQSITSQIYTGNVLNDVLSSPLGQMGQDFLSSKINDASSGIIDATNGTVNGFSSFEAAQKMVFNTMMSALALKNDLMLMLLRNVAQQAINAIEAKKTILNTLEEKIRLLYNALVILVAGNPQYNAYLNKLRQALKTLSQSEADLKTVSDTYAATGNFLFSRFASVQTELDTVIAALEPANEPSTLQFNSAQPLAELGTDVAAAVGIPDSQTLTTMLSIPNLAKDALVAADQYFLAVAKVNALLDAFKAGLGQLQTVAAGKMQDYIVSSLNANLQAMDAVVTQMATMLNGSPTSINGPNPNFIASPHAVSRTALTWVINLKVIKTALTGIPTQGLKNIQLSTGLLGAYNTAVTIIKTKNNRSGNGAQLTATQGDEQIGDLESQLLVFLSASQVAIASGTVKAGILPLGRTMLARLDLSLAQDAEIEIALQTFVNFPIPQDLQTIMAAIQAMLAAFGLDRALDQLNSGNFADFFNMDSKTATYAGAALVGLGALKKCLNFNPDFSLDLNLKNLYFSFFLRFQRTAARNIRLQINANLKALQGCSGLIVKIRGLGGLCGLTDGLAPSALFSSLSPALGATNLDRLGT